MLYKKTPIFSSLRNDFFSTKKIYFCPKNHFLFDLSCLAALTFDPCFKDEIYKNSSAWPIWSATWTHNTLSFRYWLTRRLLCLSNRVLEVVNFTMLRTIYDHCVFSGHGVKSWRGVCSGTRHWKLYAVLWWLRHSRTRPTIKHKFLRLVISFSHTRIVRRLQVASRMNTSVDAKDYAKAW